jgi:dTDP-glucose 4,6-dehydratase
MMSQAKEPVNIGNPREMTMLEFAEAVRAATGSRSKIVFKPLPQDDPRQRQPDITRARTMLNWEPCVGLAKGLERTIAYFREKLASRKIKKP